MIPAPFDYHRPQSLDEAIGLLSRHGAQAKLLSGGMSLLPTLKLRLGSFAHLVDINRIPGLDAIKEEGGFLRARLVEGDIGLQATGVEDRQDDVANDIE